MQNRTKNSFSQWRLIVRLCAQALFTVGSFPSEITTLMGFEFWWLWLHLMLDIPVRLNRYLFTKIMLNTLNRNSTFPPGSPFSLLFPFFIFGARERKVSLCGRNKRMKENCWSSSQRWDIDDDSLYFSMGVHPERGQGPFRGSGKH